MTRTIRYLILLGSFFLPVTEIYAQEGEIVYREVEEGTLEDLRSDADLDYPLEVGENAGWFQTIFEWIATGLEWFYSLISKGGLSREFLYLLSFAAAIVLIWLLLRSQYSWVFTGRSREGKIDYQVHREDIHSIDFEDQIQKAIGNENYRLAVRLLYLRTLKLMSDYQLIHWAEGKTNNQYARELNNSKVADLFYRLSYQYSYLWYGHFDAVRSHWEESSKVFNEIENKIRET